MTTTNTANPAPYEPGMIQAKQKNISTAMEAELSDIELGDDQQHNSNNNQKESDGAKSKTMEKEEGVHRKSRFFLFLKLFAVMVTLCAVAIILSGIKRILRNKSNNVSDTHDGRGPLEISPSPTKNITFIPTENITFIPTENITFIPHISQTQVKPREVELTGAPTFPSKEPKTNQPVSTPCPTQKLPAPQTNQPVSMPSPTNSPASTDDGTTTKPSDMPTKAPTAPTSAPSLPELYGIVSNLTPHDVLSDPETPQHKAYQWMAHDDQHYQSFKETTSDVAILAEMVMQRYSVTVLHYSLGFTQGTIGLEDECQWPSITCDGENVAELSFSDKMLNGIIPPEIRWLSHVTKIDMGSNQIHGSIPEELFEMTQLQYLYLENNRLTGTISEEIVNTQNLIAIYLGGNQMTGTIPDNIGSKGGVQRPLRYFSIHNNQFSGTIPDNLRLRRLFYLDISHNQLTGTFSDGMAADLRRLRHFYADHNKFSGTVPSNLPEIGNQRVLDLTINDNSFTGTLPTAFNKNNLSLLTYRFQNNNWNTRAKISGEVCSLFVLEGTGEMVEMGANCDYCPCDEACNRCID